MSKTIYFPLFVDQHQQHVAACTDDHIRAIHARMLELGLPFPQYKAIPSLPQSASTCTGYAIRTHYCTACGTGVPWGGMGPIHYHDCKTPGASWTDEKPATPAPASPPVVDDEAKVPPGIVALIKLFERVAHTSVFSDSDLAHEIYAMVRRGEVPGLTTTAEAQEALSAAAEDRYFTIAELKNERDTIKAQAITISKMHDEAMSARDALQAEVERLRAERIGLDAVFEEKDYKFRMVSDERDTLKAEVERMRSVIHAAYITVPGTAPCPICTEKALNIPDGKCICKPGQYLRQAQSERDAAIARAEAAEALLRESFNLWHDSRAWDHHALLDRIDAHLAKYGKDASK